MKRKLLIINKIQFGYSAGFLQYTRYLKSDFNITYLCYDHKRKPFQEEGVVVRYISRVGNSGKRNLRFILSIFKLLRLSKYHCVFISYFPGCSIIPLLYNKNQFIHLNIRTGSVSENRGERRRYNKFLRFESSFFKSISTISKGLRSYLKISSDALIFPLGADPINIISSVKHKVSMIYVGTFTDRNIEVTIEGISLFIKKNPGANISYIIIGDGWKNEQEVIKEKIKIYNLEKYVSLKGYVPQNELKPYFESCNIGVAYIPITSYYDCQPSTKIYEYLMAGMPVLATGTFENKQIINKNNGIVVDDTPKGFAEGISYLYNHITDFNMENIKSSVLSHRWSTIVEDMKNEIIKFNT